MATAPSGALGVFGRRGVPGDVDELLDVAAVIRARAQQTRRRVQRVNRLNRAHITADLAQIEWQVQRLTALLVDPARPTPGGRGRGKRPRR